MENIGVLLVCDPGVCVPGVVSRGGKPAVGVGLSAPLSQTMVCPADGFLWPHSCWGPCNLHKFLITMCGSGDAQQAQVSHTSRGLAQPVGQGVPLEGREGEGSRPHCPLLAASGTSLVHGGVLPVSFNLVSVLCFFVP